MSDRPYFSIVIPIHNEAGFLEQAIGRLAGELSQVPVPIEVLLVENGSTDGTLSLARDIASRHPGHRVLDLARADYGASMRAGFLAAVGEWAVNFDIDYFSGRFLQSVIELEGSADLVLASKLAPGSKDRRSSLRRLGTRVFNRLLRLLFASRVSDTHGMKAVRRRVVEEVVPLVEATEDLFDTELVLRAERAGYRLIEMPALVEELRRARSPLLRRVPRTLAGLMKMRGRL